MYVTAGRIAIASVYGRDEYESALTTLSSNFTSYDEITFLVLGRRPGILFGAVVLPQRFLENPFVPGDACLTPSSQRSPYVSVQHMDRN